MGSILLNIWSIWLKGLSSSLCACCLLSKALKINMANNGFHGRSPYEMSMTNKMIMISFLDFNNYKITNHNIRRMVVNERVDLLWHFLLHVGFETIHRLLTLYIECIHYIWFQNYPIKMGKNTLKSTYFCAMLKVVIVFIGIFGIIKFYANILYCSITIHWSKCNEVVKM